MRAQAPEPSRPEPKASRAIQEAIRQALTEERMIGAIVAAGDRPRRPEDQETERLVIGAAVAGEVEIFVLDDLGEEDFSIPLYRWALTQLRAGARNVSELVAAADGEGMSGDGLRRELEALAMQPVILVPPIEKRIERLRELTARRKIRDRLKTIVSRLELDEFSAAQAIDEAARLADGGAAA